MEGSVRVLRGNDVEKDGLLLWQTVGWRVSSQPALHCTSGRGNFTSPSPAPLPSDWPPLPSLIALTTAVDKSIKRIHQEWLTYGLS